VQISAKVALSLHEIADKARMVDSIVAEIAQASQEQSQGVGQVNITVSQMDKVTQSNASNAEETAAAAEELTAQSTVLSEAVSDLSRLVENEKKGTKPSAKPATSLHSSKDAISKVPSARATTRRPMVAGRFQSGSNSKKVPATSANSNR